MFDINKIRDVHLFGINLKDSEGNPFPDELLQTYLDSAISWTEKKLNIAIMPREEEEHHDYFLQDYSNWGFLKLWKKPVMEVHSLEMYYGDRPMFTIPKDWLKVDELSGQIQIFPTSGSAGGMIITANGSLVTPVLSGNVGYAPKLWKVKYKAGMVQPDEAEPHVYRRAHIHPDLEELVYKRASAAIMTVWGDLILGAGIANQSISIDGLSQSIGTTQSPMYGGASARINQLNEDVKDLMKALRSYYGGIDFTVV
jgi:hypothetical protein